MAAIQRPRAVGILLILVCVAPLPLCWAGKATIYFDDFSGVGPLNGTAPDVRPGLEIWSASEVFGADGIVSTAKGASGSTYQALLPFVPQTGRTYVLSLDMNPSTAGTTDLTQWFGLGFTNSDSTAGSEFWNTGIAWVLQRITRNRQDNDEIQTFLGPGMVGSQSHPSKEAGKVTLTVVLDTTPAQWTVQWLRNGQSIRGPVAYATNPAIRYVGFTKVSTAGGTVDNFELKLSDLTAPLASYPIPADQTVDVLRDAVLSWEPGVDAVTHDIYLGPVLVDVNTASRANPMGLLASKNQDSNTYDPTAMLEFGRTYYWRVDEVASEGTIAKGKLWQFTTEPKGYPIAGNLITATASSTQAGYGPENTINGSGLNAQDGHSTTAAAMWQSAGGAVEPVWIQYAFDRVYKLHELWVWNYNADLESLVGFGLKDVTIECSLDGIGWTTLGNFTFAQGTSKAGYTANTKVDFAGAVARYVRLVVKSSWGNSGRHGLSEVRFLYVPTWARQPEPASSATGVDTDVALTWRSGRDAVSHNVYLGTDRQAVVAGTALAAAVNENRYDAGTFNLGTTYYWRVDEVNLAEAVATWTGDVWSFTTQDSYVVDDFESYNDNQDAGLTIWQSWVDGYGTSTNGSQVGHTNAPFAERTIVQGGRQSMPFAYNNQGTVPMSEAVRTFATAQDWTRGGVTSLSLFFRGVPENITGRMYVKINDAKVIYSGDGSDITKPFWIQWTINLAGVVTNLKKVTKLCIGIDNGGAGTLYFDDIRLYRVAPRQAVEEVWTEAEAADPIVPPMRIYSDRADASGGACIAAFGDNSSGDPPDNGVAGYRIKLTGGTYRIIGRVIAPAGNDDSFWGRFQGATTNTANHVSGWIRWGLDIGTAWHEVPVRSMDDADRTVLFTVTTPGFYSLQITYREDGAMLDSFIITKQLQ